MPKLVLMNPSPRLLPGLGRDQDVDLTIFVSSNLLQLRAYRQAVLELCRHERLWPLMIERPSHTPAEAIRRSIQLIEQASVYLGIFSHIDGHGPTEEDRSRIGMECDRALMRGLPCWIFIGREEHHGPLAAAELAASQQWMPSMGSGVSLEFFCNSRDLRAALGTALGGFRAQLRRTRLSRPTPPSPTPPDLPRDSLTAPLEEFHSMIDQERYEQAYELFSASLYEPMCVRWSLCDDAANCLQRLFPEGIEAPPSLSTADQRLSAVWSLAYCYQYSGRVARAARLWRQILDDQRHPSLDLFSSIRAWHNLSESRVDDLFAAEAAARVGLLLAQQVGGGSEFGTILGNLGVLLSLRGSYLQAFSVFKQAVASTFESDKENDVGLYAEFSHHALRTGHVDMAADLARHAHELSLAKNLARPPMRVFNLRSAISEARGDLVSAIEEASSAMSWSRTMSFCSEEIRGLLSLARLHEKQGELELALGFLKDLWPLVERGPYPLDRARGLNILARLELQRGHAQAATAAALEAHKLAGGASGPPFSNPRQMAEARRTLGRLGVEAPPGPPGFHQSPLPEVTIDRYTI